MDYLDATSGILVAPESYTSLVNGFAEAMQKLIDAPELAKSMGEAGHERAVRDFDWQRRIDKVIGLYGELAEKSESHRKLIANRISQDAVSGHR